MQSRDKGRWECVCCQSVGGSVVEWRTDLRTGMQELLRGSLGVVGDCPFVIDLRKSLLFCFVPSFFRVVYLAGRRSRFFSRVSQHRKVRWEDSRARSWPCLRRRVLACPTCCFEDMTRVSSSCRCPCLRHLDRAVDP